MRNELLKQNYQRTFLKAAILKRDLVLAQMILTSLQNDLLHRVSFQVFTKVFCTHSVGFLQIFKSFSSNLR